MNILISGGAKNGKSYYAQRLAKETAEKHGCPLYYIATMIPRDEEDRARIRRHLAEREGWGFETLEQGRNLTDLLKDPSVDRKGAFLLDSVTALLSNEMFDEDGRYDPDAAERVAADCAAFAEATGNTVFVSDYIYGDADRYDELTENYRRSLAGIDRRLAGVCGCVLEVTAGQTVLWKGPAGFEEEL